MYLKFVRLKFLLLLKIYYSKILTKEIKEFTATIPSRVSHTYIDKILSSSKHDNTYWKLVRMTMGWPKKLGTSSSIRECVWIKLRVRSGRDRESLTHWPGLGSGTLVLCTGSQFELIALCSLKFPLNVSVMSCKEKAHTAEPLMLFTGVVNVPYINCADLLPYWPDINSVVDSENNARPVISEPLCSRGLARVSRGRLRACRRILWKIYPCQPFKINGAARISNKRNEIEN